MAAAEFVRRYAKEMSLFSYVMTLRFLGRYPETSRSYYKPPALRDDPSGRDGVRQPCCHEHLLEMTYSHLIYRGDYGHEQITDCPGCTR